MSFTPGEWARVKEVFDRARPLPVGERKGFVAAACATDPALQEHVEKLLAAHQLASGFLETPPVLSEAGPIADVLEWQEIGGSRLISLIGAGGSPVRSASSRSRWPDRAIETARSQAALTFELRAATAFAHLSADRDNAAAARASLQRVLDGLGDAEETVDVRRARAILTGHSN